MGFIFKERVLDPKIPWFFVSLEENKVWFFFKIKTFSIQNGISKKKKKSFLHSKNHFWKEEKGFKKKKIYKNFLFGRLFRVLNRRLFENIFSLENGGHWDGHHILYLLPLRPPFPNDVRILTPKVRWGLNQIEIDLRKVFRKKYNSYMKQICYF